MTALSQEHMRRRLESANQRLETVRTLLPAVVQAGEMTRVKDLLDHVRAAQLDVQIVASEYGNGR